MTPWEFVEGLRAGGSIEFADDVDIDYCPLHGWPDHLYHEDECTVYAAHLALFLA